MQVNPIKPEIERSAAISRCGNYRWTLHRKWGDGYRVCWIMLNPSTADAERDDPTLRRCIHFSKAWGYGSLIVVNLYPFRSSSPEECRRWAGWEGSRDWYIRDAIHFQNLPVVVEAAKQCQMVVAGWGAAAWVMDFATHLCAEVMEGTGHPIYCLGTTKSGAPLHPMARGRNRVPDDQQPILWRQP